MKEDDCYDWANAKRGMHAKSAAGLAAAIRLLEADLVASFPDSAAVNHALRLVLALRDAVPPPAKKPAKRAAPKRAGGRRAA